MSERDAILALGGAKIGSLLFVSYVAGRAPTPRAIREAARARREGLARRHFLGRLSSVFLTRDGRFAFRVETDVRDDERRGTREAFRTFSPSVGDLLGLEILDEAA